MGVSQKVLAGKIVGSFVYEAYTPSKCGVVLEDLGEYGAGYFHKLLVKYKNGTVKETTSAGLNDYEELIADHERKLNNHRKVLEQLKQLLP